MKVYILFFFLVSAAFLQDTRASPQELRRVRPRVVGTVPAPAAATQIQYEPQEQIYYQAAQPVLVHRRQQLALVQKSLDARDQAFDSVRISYEEAKKVIAAREIELDARDAELDSRVRALDKLTQDNDRRLKEREARLVERERVLAEKELNALAAAELREQQIDQLSRDRETAAVYREKALEERERLVELKERSIEGRTLVQNAAVAPVAVVQPQQYIVAGRRQVLRHA